MTKAVMNLTFKENFKKIFKLIYIDHLLEEKDSIAYLFLSPTLLFQIIQMKQSQNKDVFSVPTTENEKLLISGASAI